MAYLTDIPIKQNNNCIPFENNVVYTWTRFIQTYKMLKGLIDMFFNNFDLAPMQKHLSHKNINKMRTLLTKLLYGSVIW